VNNKTMCSLISTVLREEKAEGYPEWEDVVRRRVEAAAGPLLYTAGNVDLAETFLSYLPGHRRQHYRCNACRRFIEKYGSAVRVDEVGRMTTVLWEADRAVPQFFRAAVAACRHRVLRAEVVGVFLDDEPVWGTPLTGPWTHLHGTPPSVFKHPLKTAAQARAEKEEEHGMLRRGMADFPLAVVEQAVRVLEADTLDRSEKTLGVAQWLLALHRAVAGRDRRSADNLVWRAVATAPPGFCHVRSTMINTLLEDLAAGLPFEDVKRRWAAKMHPLKYQRPTAPPKQGTIDRAERVVAGLQSAGALRRRFAKLSDVVAYWMPRTDISSPSGGGGVFTHLRPRVKTPAKLELPPQKMTWVKFEKAVLLVGGVSSLEVKVPHGLANFFGLVTAADPAAPPIVQWDTEPRNPVSWYHYGSPRVMGSFAHQWNLVPGSWAKVTAVFERPCHWFHPDKFKHYGRAVHLSLEGCKDVSYPGRGAGWFTEMLRSEYHEVRSVMEAAANAAAVEGRDEGDANGIAIQGSSGVLVRVSGPLGTATYEIDRLD
jgi:hypothetical protein